MSFVSGAGLCLVGSRLRAGVLSRGTRGGKREPVRWRHRVYGGGVDYVPEARHGAPGDLDWLWVTVGVG